MWGASRGLAMTTARGWIVGAGRVLGAGLALLLVWLSLQSFRGNFLLLYDQLHRREYFVYRGRFFVVAQEVQCPTALRFHWGEGSRLFEPTGPEVRTALTLWPVSVVLLGWVTYPYLPPYRRWRRRRAGLCVKCGYC